MPVSLPHTIKLRHPVTGEDGSIVLDKLVLERRPCSKAMTPLVAVKSMEREDPDAMERAMYTAISKAFAVEMWKLERIDVEDFMEAFTVVMGFLPAGRRTGTPPSGSSQPS